LDYTSKQLRFVTRTIDQRKELRYIASSSETETKRLFEEKYRQVNKPVLTYWAIFCGTNTHRTAAMAFSLVGRFDLFFWVSLAWTVFIIPISYYQAKVDRKLLNEMRGETKN